MLISILKFLVIIIIIAIISVFGYQYVTGQSLFSIIDKAVNDSADSSTIDLGKFDPNVLSENITKEIPIFPGATFVQSIEIFDGNSAYFATEENSNKIRDYYNKEMTNRGWTKATEYSQGPMIGLVFNKGNKSATFALGSVLYNKRGFVINLVNR